MSRALFHGAACGESDKAPKMHVSSPGIPAIIPRSRARARIDYVIAWFKKVGAKMEKKVFGNNCMIIAKIRARARVLSGTIEIIARVNYLWGQRDGFMIT